MLTIRASMLPNYADCPRRGISKILKRELTGYTFNRSPQSIAALVGTAFHAGAGNIMQFKLADLKFNQSDAEEVSIENLRSNLESSATEFDAVTPTTNTGEKQIRTLINSFIHEAEPSIFPALPPEYSRRAACSPVLHFPADTELSGHLDVETSGNEIIDFKTGKSAYFQSQMGAYSLLKKSVEKKSAGKLTVWYFPRVALSKPYPGASAISYPVVYSEKIAFNTMQFIARDINNFMKSGDPDCIACNPKSNLCSEKFCMAFNTEFCRITLK